MTDSPLLTRIEAARWCRVSVAAFDTHVRPHLPVKRIGRRVVFHRADLEAWAASDEVKPTIEIATSPRPHRVSSGQSPLRALLQADPRAQDLRERLQSKLKRRAQRQEAS